MLRRSLLLLLALAFALPAAAQSSYQLWEGGQVRPMALSGNLLFVLNTPNNRLEVFVVKPGGLGRLSSVPVGVEPVSLAVRNSTEVWVVNHLSDSVSIVDASDPFAPVVSRTLLVGDEPRDVVFAGSPERAFISTAHRGQHRTHPSVSGAPGTGDPQLTTPGVGRTDVWVFDAGDLDQGVTPTMGGVPARVLSFFGDTPRPLATDGTTVYVGVLYSGNQTATVSEGMVCDGFGGSQCSGDGVTSPNGLAGGNLPGGNPGPSTNVELVTAPETGLIVKYDDASSEWRDEGGRNWSNGVRFTLPDLDVFSFSANFDPATFVEGTDATSYAHVGTTLFNMALNPVNGNLYVSNTDAQNLTRFEGPGVFGSTTVQGNLAQSHVTVITQPGGVVKPRHLNRHIDYSVLPAPAGIEAHSLATPVDITVSSNGSTLYVAAFGSSNIGVFDTADLENDSLWDNAGPEFDPTVESANYISVSGGGPAGLALDEANNRLYALTRFNNSVVSIDLGTGTEQYALALDNPEPDSVVDGRPMLYDAIKTSSNGETSCSSCHVFGDFDQLAWDLGNPDDHVTESTIPINLGIAAGPEVNGGADVDEFHPMKGPMTTQTLRGLVTAGAMHWRGDRVDGFFGQDPYTGDDGDEDLSFRNFIVAFEGLVGDDVPATNAQRQTDMQAFTDFALQLRLPPNPIRDLANGLNASQTAGELFTLGISQGFSDGVPIAGLGFSCEGCHTISPANGHFGTGELASFENETQIMKIPHFRNLYQKIGMFGMPNVDFNNSTDSSHQGDQIRGFGFLHDGSTDSVFRFFQATVFNCAFLNTVGFCGGNNQRRDVEAFMHVADTDFAPVVGQQVTDHVAAGADTLTRIGLLKQRAGAAFTSAILGGTVTECDLIVHAMDDGEHRGWLYVPGADNFESDRNGETASQIDLSLAATGGDSVTYTCAPPGSGVRMAIDEDEDGFLNGDERDAGTDPTNAGSAPGACSDGIDNDDDGSIDLADAGCANASSTIENPQCDDGVNNDLDGLVDLLDPHCVSAADNREAPNPSSSCGLGAEMALLLPVLLVLRRRRG